MLPSLDLAKDILPQLKYLVPGLVILYVRSQFLTGRLPKNGDAALGYLAVTIFYYGMLWPLVPSLGVLSEASQITLYLLVVPAIVGAVLGKVAHSGGIGRLLQHIGVDIIHPMPTAWDYVFAQRKQHFVLVVLKDGTKFAGAMLDKSFASSEPSERDIYLEKSFEITSRRVKGKMEIDWKPRGNSVWVCASEIRSIEFWPHP